MIRMTKQKYERNEQRIARALLAPFVVLTIQYFLLVSFNLIGTTLGTRVQFMSLILVALLYLLALPVVLRKNPKRFILVYLLASSVFLVHYFVFPENQIYMQSIFFDVFFMSIPSFIYSMALSDFNIFKRSMFRAAHIVMVFGALTAIFSFSGKAFVGTYSMALSYYMLLPAIVYLDRLIDEFSLIYLLLLIALLGIILSLGSRGAVLCLAVFFLLKIIKPNAKWTKLRAMGYGSLLSALIVALVFFEKIILLLYTYFLQLGINSRTLRLFLQDNLHLSGRDRLYQSVVSEIVNSPFTGIGIAGDYRVIGNYVHNFFIEVLGNFGVVLGGLSIMIIVIWLFRLLFKSDKFVFSLVSMWTCLGFVHLMVSSSYLIDVRFWIFLGVVVNFTLGTGKKGMEN